MDNLSINIKIENRSYPLTIHPEKEESLRKAGKFINEKIKKFRAQFGNRIDIQDILSMLAIEIVSQNLEIKQKAELQEKNLVEELYKIDQKLSDQITL